MYVCALMYVRANVKSDCTCSNIYIYIHPIINIYIISYGTEVWNGSFKQVWNGGHGTGVVPDLVPTLIIWLAHTYIYNYIYIYVMYGFLFTPCNAAPARQHHGLPRGDRDHPDGLHTNNPGLDVDRNVRGPFLGSSVTCTSQHHPFRAKF